ncbi:MAG: sugar ABC transporter permease [Thermoleophilia bacterium]|nr:sugar ABC transporter permease [Thermoleophilia bacterium]
MALRPRARRTLAARRRSEIVTAYLFLAPGFVVFAAAILYPIGRAFQISLHEWAIVPGIASEYLGLDNYRRALDDPIFWKALQNTGVYMLATVPAQIVLGLAAAVLLDARMPARALFRTLYYLPVITSWVVVSLLFRYLFLTDGGLVNWTLTDGVHLADENVSWLGDRWTALAAISVLGVWKGVGWSMVIFLAALQGVPSELKEAAAVDGANAWRRFRAVSLPAIRPVVAFVTILLVIGGFNVFVSVFLITGGGPGDDTEVLLTYMYRQAFTFLDFGYGAAISFVLTAIVFVLSLVQLRLFRRPEAAR